MKFCGNCGKPLEDGAQFCGYCGSSVPDDMENTYKDEINNYEDNEETIGAEENNELGNEIKDNTEKITDDVIDNKKFEFNDNVEVSDQQNAEINEELYSSNVNNDNNNQVSKKSIFRDKRIISILIGVLIFCLGTGVVYLSQQPKKKSSSFTSEVNSNDDRIHITLSSVEPAYTVNGDEAEIDYTHMKFHWKTDGDNEESKDIVEDINDDSFTYSKSSGLKNGDEVTVKINVDEDDYTITGEQTFTVKFDTEIEEDESENETQTIDERIRDADGYVFENSDSEYLTASQLSSIKTPTQLRIAINEIYARHGYSFTNNNSIQRYFDAKNWYYKDEYLYEDSQMVWNTYEDANLKKLAKLRKGKLKYNPSSELNV